MQKPLISFGIVVILSILALCPIRSGIAADEIDTAWGNDANISLKVSSAGDEAGTAVTAVCVGEELEMTATLSENQTGPDSFNIWIRDGSGEIISGDYSPLFYPENEEDPPYSAPSTPGDFTITAGGTMYKAGKNDHVLEEDSKTIKAVDVGISLPDGIYVGAGKDTATITLEAEAAPSSLTGETYSWSVVKADSDGDGTFSSASASTPEFSGTQRGRVTAKVEMTYETAKCEATANLVVIEINDLSESVPEDDYPEVSVDCMGDVTVSYYVSGGASVGGGELRAVLIAPTDNPSDPYEWDTDFYAEVNHETGDVTIHVCRPGPYLVKTIRDDAGTPSEKIVELLYDAPPLKDGATKKTGKTTKIAFPSADLILISSAGDSANAAARSSITGEVLVDDVDDAIAAINAKWAANGNVPFTLIIIDHGRSAHQSVGDGQAHLPRGYINPTAGTALTDFMNACNGKVTSCKLLGCNVADGAAGEAFLQQLADGGNMSVKAYKGSVYPVYGLLGLVNHWSASAGGTIVTKAPSP